MIALSSSFLSKDFLPFLHPAPLSDKAGRRYDRNSVGFPLRHRFCVSFDDCSIIFIACSRQRGTFLQRHPSTHKSTGRQTKLSLRDPMERFRKSYGAKNHGAISKERGRADRGEPSSLASDITGLSSILIFCFRCCSSLCVAGFCFCFCYITFLTFIEHVIDCPLVHFFFSNLLSNLESSSATPAHNKIQMLYLNFF